MGSSTNLVLAPVITDTDLIVKAICSANNAI